MVLSILFIGAVLKRIVGLIMRILAVDFGNTRTGLAVCDSREILASPIAPVKAKTISAAATAVAAVAKERQIECIVVGLPLNENGTESKQTKNARIFAYALDNELGSTIPVEMIDERFTTLQAHENLHEANWSERQQKDRVDSESARLILETYLEERRNKKAPDTEGEEKADPEQE